MNSRERVFALLSGQKPDRQPFTLTLSMYGAQLIDVPLRDYYTNPQLYVQGQIAVAQEIQPDILFTPFALVKEAHAFGSEIVYLKDNPPNMSNPAVTSPHEVKQLHVPSLHHPDIQYTIRATELMKKHLGNDKVIAAIMTSPIDLPIIILGLDVWMETLLFYPEIAYSFVARLKSHFIAFATALFDAGADFIVLPSVFINTRIIDEQRINEFSLPLLRDTFTHLPGPVVLHHGGAAIQNMLHIFDQLPNVIGIAVSSQDNLAQCRAAMHPDKILLGNINGPNLWRLKPEHLRVAIEQILQSTKQDRRFILASSSADIAMKTPLANLKEFMHTIKSHTAAQ